MKVTKHDVKTYLMMGGGLLMAILAANKDGKVDMVKAIKKAGLNIVDKDGNAADLDKILKDL